MSSQPFPPPMPTAPEAIPRGSARFTWMLFAHLAIWAFFTIFCLQIVPRFTKVVEDLDAQLPAMTLMIIDITNVTKNNWYYLPVFILPGYAAGLYVVHNASRVAARIWTYALFGVFVLFMMLAALALGLPFMNLTGLT
jgi:type II secretory pathway component PulF